MFSCYHFLSINNLIKNVQSVENPRAQYYSYMPGNTRRRANIAICIQKWNDKCSCFSAENLLEVSPVVINYKMRHNKNRPARYSLVWPHHFSVINICGGKTEKHGLDMRGYVQG